jgi:hypothetical protein
MVQLIQIKKYLLEGFTMNSVLRSSYKTIITTASYSFLKLLKLSKILGYRFSFFSASQLITPVLGAEISAQEFVVITALRTILHLSVQTSLTIFGLLYYVPTFIGALYFKAALAHSSSLTSKIMRILAPLACMALFVSTSVGSQAWVYSLYWLVPVVITLLPHRSIFLSALASTFMVHAIGSVLFILSTPMVPAFWLGLLPIVALERCMIAAGITGLYYAVKLTQHMLKIVTFRFANA